jgi:hypothetical protein
MSEKLNFMPGLLAVALILIGLVLAGCSAGGTGSTTQDTSTTHAQTNAAPAQSGTTVSTDNSSGAASTPSQGNASSGRQRGWDMSKQFSRAAQILGITEAQLTSAFQQAQESVFGKAPTGTPPSGASGQPPMPPSGTWTQHSAQTPSGASDQQSTRGGRGPNTESMQKLYSKMSEILGISADKISSAMDQARQEMQPTTTK